MSGHFYLAGDDVELSHNGAGDLGTGRSPVPQKREDQRASPTYGPVEVLADPV
jgi:hypothetical protein